MTPLETAKALADLDPFVGDSNGSGYCRGCDLESPSHAPDCPLIHLPKIVAALEAADRVVGRFESMADAECGAIARDMRGLILRLGLALQGEEVKA